MNWLIVFVTKESSRNPVSEKISVSYMSQIFFYSFGGSLATLLRAVSDCGLGPCKQA